MSEESSAQPTLVGETEVSIGGKLRAVEQLPNANAEIYLSRVLTLAQ
jgi:hypothetical protein